MISFSKHMIIGKFLYWYFNTFTTQKNKVIIQQENYNKKNQVIKGGINNLKNSINIYSKFATKKKCI